MTDAEAEAMLVELAKHYGQPVMPVKRYCDAIKTWAECVVAKHQKGPGGSTYGQEYYTYLRRIIVDIRKSNLLYRLIYIGEKFRPVPCPTHLGEPCLGDCKDCDRTGWAYEVR